jgi:hypothetical protein
MNPRAVSIIVLAEMPDSAPPSFARRDSFCEETEESLRAFGTPGHDTLKLLSFLTSRKTKIDTHYTTFKAEYLSLHPLLRGIYAQNVPKV